MRKQSKSNKPKKQGNIFDIFVKDMFCRIYIFADFLLHYANPAFVKSIDLSTLRLVNTHFFDKAGNEKIADLVFQCNRKGSDEKAMVVIVFEHFSNNLYFLPLKLLTYLVGFWNGFITNNEESKLLPAPYFIVLRTGKRPLVSHKMLRDIVVKLPGYKGAIPNFTYDIVDLPSIPFDKIVGGPQLLVTLGVLKKLTEGFEEEFDEALVAANQIEDSAECTELLCRTLQLVAKVFIAKEKKFDREQVTRSLHKVFKGREKKMLPTIFDEIKAEGQAEGQAEGKARGKIESIIQILESRFQVPTTGVEKKLSKITDLELLAVLLERALYCESLKAFTDSLRNE